MINAAHAANIIDNAAQSNDPMTAMGRRGLLNGAGKPNDVDKVSKDFESMFISQMLESMFGDSIGDEAFGDRETSEIYKGLMIQEYGKQVTNAGGIGIADYVKRELIKLQEEKP